MSSYICVYCRKRWIYLLCDDNTARIIKGHIGRSKRFKISGIIEVAGQKYKILGIGWRSFNKPKRLKHITFPDSIEYVDEDEFTFLPKLQTVHIGKGLEDLFDWHFRRSGRQVQIFIDKDNPYINGKDIYFLVEELRKINSLLRIDATMTSGYCKDDTMAELITGLNTRGSYLDVW